MTQSINTLIHNLKRPAYMLAALGFIFTSVMTVIPAHAGQVQSRSIMMSDNGVSGGTITTGVGSGTNVTYRVTFEAASTYTVKAIVVDFCSGSAGTPFIGDATCGAPTAFNVGTTPTIDVTSYNSIAGLTTGTWTADSLNSGQTFRMVNTTGEALTAGTDYTFAISGITNTSDLGTFYARLITYVDDTGASSPASYTHGAPGTFQDYGGFALSTAEVVQVSARVQEALTFCVSGHSDIAGAPTTPGEGTAPADCDDTTAPAITLGHGTNNTLDASRVDINEVWTIVSTNALNGVAIRMVNSNACGGLSADDGATCPIEANSSGAATPDLITAGDAFFGMFCEKIAGGDGNDVDCDASYNDATNLGPETQPITTTSTAAYGMDTLSSGENVTTLYGDTVASSAGPASSKVNRYQFAASAAATTPAGIYRANLAMIATGTF